MGKLRTKEIISVSATQTPQDPILFGIEYLIDSVSKQYEIDISNILGAQVRSSDIHDFARDLVTGKISYDLQMGAPTSENELREMLERIVDGIVEIAARNTNGKSFDPERIKSLLSNGLLPLANVISKQVIVDEISRLTGLTNQEIFETCFKIQEIDFEHRQLELSEIFEQFLREKEKRAVPTQTIKGKNIPVHEVPTRNTPVSQDPRLIAEEERAKLLKKVANLKDDLSVLRFDNAILCHELYVALGFMDQGVMDRIIHTLNNPHNQQYSFTNGSVWHTVGALRIATGSMSGQGLATLFISRAVDIDNECGLAQKACDYMLSDEIDDEVSINSLKLAVKNIERIKSSLENLHKGSIAGCFRVDDLTRAEKGTSAQWKQLITNPVFANSFGDARLFTEVDEMTLRDLSLVYHLPLDLTDIVLNGNFPGVVSSIDQDAIDASIKSINGIDFLQVDVELATHADKAKWVAHSVRAGYGTVGDAYVRGDEIPAAITANRPQIVASMLMFGEFANRYEDLSLKPKSDLIGQLRVLNRWDSLRQSTLSH